MPEQRCPNCDYELEGTMFLKAIIAAERERCAKIARSLISTDRDWDNAYWNQACERIALTIEAPLKD